MTDIAAKDGLDFHLVRARSGTTFDAHHVLDLADWAPDMRAVRGNGKTDPFRAT